MEFWTAQMQRMRPTVHCLVSRIESSNDNNDNCTNGSQSVNYFIVVGVTTLQNASFKFHL